MEEESTEPPERQRGVPSMVRTTCEEHSHSPTSYAFFTFFRRTSFQTHTSTTFRRCPRVIRSVSLEGELGRKVEGITPFLYEGFQPRKWHRRRKLKRQEERSCRKNALHGPSLKSPDRNSFGKVVDGRRCLRCRLPQLVTTADHGEEPATEAGSAALYKGEDPRINLRPCRHPRNEESSEHAHPNPGGARRTSRPSDLCCTVPEDTFLRIAGSTRLQCPMRYLLALFLSAGLLLLYGLRFSLSVALVAMVNQTAAAQQETTDGTREPECRTPVAHASNVAVRSEGELDWSPATQGLILGAFFYGYTLSQIPGGALSERFGGKWPFGLGVLCTSLLTLATPVAVTLGVSALVTVRFLEGLGEGMTYPAMFSMVGKWAPPQERGSLLAVAYIGSNVGAVIAMPAAAFFCDSPKWGWQYVFYVFGTVGCAYFVLYAWRVQSMPQWDTWITEAELKHIERSTSPRHTVDVKVPWTAILTSVPLLALTASRFAAMWGQFTMLTGVPTYLASVLHMPIQKNGLVTAAIFTAQSVGTFAGGFMGDYLCKYCNRTWIRKFFQTFALLGAGMLLSLVPIAACDETLATVFLVLAMGVYGLAAGGVAPAVVDMAPDLAGTLYGICGTVAHTSGFLAPLLVGLVTTPRPTLTNWSHVFYVTSAVYVVGALAFLCFGSAEPQPWGARPRVRPVAGRPSVQAVASDDPHCPLTSSFAESLHMY